MSIYTIPAPDAPAEDWGRLANSLPGWRWMPGMRIVVPPQQDGATGYQSRVTDVGWPTEDDSGRCPGPDDPATEGCMLRLLGRPLYAVVPTGPAWWVTLTLLDHPDSDEDGLLQIRGTTLGRACIAAAASLGRWPGGEG